MATEHKAEPNLFCVADEHWIPPGLKGNWLPKRVRDGKVWAYLEHTMNGEKVTHDETQAAGQLSHRDYSDDLKLAMVYARHARALIPFQDIEPQKWEREDAINEVHKYYEAYLRG